MSATPEAASGEIKEGFYIPHGSSVAEVEASFFAEEPRSTIDTETRDRLDFRARGETLESIVRFVAGQKITGNSSDSRREAPDFPGLKPASVHTVWEPPSDLGRGAGN